MKPTKLAAPLLAAAVLAVASLASHAQAPKGEAPKGEAPKGEAPKGEAPKGEAPKAAEGPARPDPAKGQATAAICAGCHGADGNAAAPTFPKIAAQQYDYIVKQLHDYRVKPGEQAPARPNEIMQGIASGLSEDQMRDVAAYFSQMKQQPAIAHNGATVELGRSIFRGGIASKNVPACAGCHGPAGAGIPGQFPRLGGQWPEYTEAQLVAFRSHVRKNNASMTQIASRLSDDEIKAVADYVAGLR